LRSGEVGLKQRELAVWAFEKAPIPATFADLFAGFFDEFAHRGAKKARIGRPSNE
jgi:hypothetical protein